MKTRFLASTFAGFALLLPLSTLVWAIDFTPSQVVGIHGVTRYSVPILVPENDEGQVCNPTVIPFGDRLAMIYRCRFGRSRLCLAFSDDGRNFTRYASNPVLSPGDSFDKRACEDPRVVKFGDLFYLAYVGFGTQMSQCLATSKDLIHWEKQGRVLDPKDWNSGGVKAAVIVPEKINGQYIMYFLGQKQAWHTQLGMAVSDDLLHWSQPLDHPVMEPREGNFDSDGVEPGPTPVVLPEGILLIYNGWNSGHTHRTGWVLFSKEDPSKILKRCQEPFIQPTFPYELHHPPSDFNVTFTEGCAFYKGLWRFYYGAMDHSIGLAEVKDLHDLIGN